MAGIGAFDVHFFVKTETRCFFSVEDVLLVEEVVEGA